MSTSTSFAAELRTLKQELRFVPPSWDYVAWTAQRFIIGAVKTIWEGTPILYEVLEKRDRNGNPFPEQGKWGRGSLPQNFSPDMKGCIVQHMMCDVACLTMAPVVKMAIEKINREMEVTWMTLTVKPKLRFTFNSRDPSTFDPVTHSVLLISGKSVCYVLDLSRRQFGFPEADWLLPLHEYLERYQTENSRVDYDCRRHIGQLVELQTGQSGERTFWAGMQKAVREGYEAWARLPGEGKKDVLVKMISWSVMAQVAASKV
ncbi:hypothetical protein BCR34DRAFT_590782 [Clohesyomyces aquaticus]|uniref:Uncharacterized protein n=1 Tax=Clohesyomyces aquaticus TaxID=1231657 RepID=A0A1Y1Z676_9PLEO|nr:hypothetical protein BCR34DRAFT_590782 [Clohesyomyces aquaticus]